MSDTPGAAEGGVPLDQTPLIEDEVPLDTELVVDPDDEPLEPEPEPGDEPGEPPAAAPNRTQARIQTLRERAEKAEREATELRGYRQALEQRPRQPAVDPAAQQRAQLEMLRQRWEQMPQAEALIEALQFGAQQQQQRDFINTRMIEDRIDQQRYEFE